MTVGTDLLCRIFEEMASRGAPARVLRRLYCEGGHPAAKTYRYVSQRTRDRLDTVIPQCAHCTHRTLQTRTVVMVFEWLAGCSGCHGLLGEMYRSVGGPSAKAYRFCNGATQDAIRQLGLLNTGARPAHVRNKNRTTGNKSP